MNISKNFNPLCRQISQFYKATIFAIFATKYREEKNTSTADNLPYEKVGKNEPVCIADEVPFEIPESWEWVRLSNIIELQSGQDMTPDKYNSNGNGIPYITGASNIENGKVLINRWTNCGRTFAYKGDILLTCKGTVGTMAVLQESRVHIARQIMAIRPIGELYVPYIQLVLQTLVENLKVAAKSMIPGIARNDVLQSLFPVPPFNEQQRIAIKFSVIVPYMEQYSMVDTKLSSLNSIFPETLKKSILQEAIQGKLVPQDPSDEPASVLLERIRTEKEQLIQEGKIKRDKHESIIYRRDNSHYEKLDGIERCIDDEIPFEIPESWIWIRLGSLFTINPRNNISDDTVVGFMPMPLLKEGFSDSHTYEKKMWKDVKSGFTHFANNDVVIAKITPCFQNRKSAVIHDLPSGYGAGTTELHVLRDYTKILYMPYFLMICKTHAFIQNGMKNFSGTAGQQRVGKDFISNYLVPLPPINEQKRIVKKVNVVINSCNIL